MDSVNKSLRPVARPRSKTGEETKYGRPMWKDEDTGEFFSEKTVTIPYGDGFVVMPSVAEDGSELTEEQLFDYVRRNGPVDFMTGEKLPIFESMEEADTYAQKRSEAMFTDEDPTPRMDDSTSGMGSEKDGTSMMDVGKSILKLGIAGAQLAGKKMGMDIYPTEDNPYGFAEGGLAMDRQMRTFMAEGGLKDDGMNIDPVSGNEIPPGSMAEEVRDDISAQLSEGEYVVPADVVKYFGVKFFEELRSEAKAGLGQMEANGRIGGEPVPAGGPRQDTMSDEAGALSPEEMAQLEAIMGQGGMQMAQGGIVPQQYGMPIAQPQMSKGYATGGLEQEMETIQGYSTFNPADYTLGYSFTNQASQTQMAVMLYGPNGEVVSLMMPRDQAQFNSLVAQGYTTEQEVLKPKTGSEEKERETGDGDPYSGKTGMDLSSMSTEDIQNAIDAINNNTGMGKITNALSNSIIGKAIAALTGKTIAQKALDDYNKELSSRTGTSNKGTGKGTGSKGISIDGNAPADPGATAGLAGGDAPSGSAQEAADIGAQPGGTTSGGLSSGVVGLGDISESGSGMDFGGGEGPGPSGPSGGATGGGGADSGTGPSGGNASPGASGVGAPGVAGGEVGAGPGGTDAVGPMNKGGLATRKTRAKRKPTNMNKGGIASPRTKK